MNWDALSLKHMAWVAWYVAVVAALLVACANVYASASSASGAQLEAAKRMTHRLCSRERDPLGICYASTERTVGAGNGLFNASYRVRYLGWARTYRWCIRTWPPDIVADYWRGTC